MNTGITFMNSLNWDLNQPLTSESHPFTSILPERLVGTSCPKDFSILPKDLDSVTEPNAYFEEEFEIIVFD